MPETKVRFIEQQLSELETLSRNLPDQLAKILTSRWPEVAVNLGETYDAHLGEPAASSEGHDLTTDALKPLMQHIQAELDALRAQLPTRHPKSQRTLLPTEQPTRAAPSATAHRTEHSDTGLQPTTPGRDHGKIRIPPEGMGPNMASTLERLITAHGFDQLFEVTPLPIPLTTDLSEVFTLEGEPDVKANEFMTAGDGIAHVFVADVEDAVDFQWPDFTTVVERPTLGEVTRFLEGTIRAPPKIAPHFGGTFRHTLENKSPLHPGDELATLTQLAHANEEYTHIGARWLEAIGVGYRIEIQGPAEMKVTEPQQYHQITNYSTCIARSINSLPPGQQMATKTGPGITACSNCGLWPLRTIKGHVIHEVEPLEEDYFARLREPGGSGEDDDHDDDDPPPPSGRNARACTKRKVNGDLAYRPHKRTRSAAHSVTPEPHLNAGTSSAKGLGAPKVANNDDEHCSDADGPADNMAEALDRLVVMPGAQPDGDITDDVFRMAAAICTRDALKQFVDMVSYWSGHKRFAHAVSKAVIPEGSNPDTCVLVQRCRGAFGSSTARREAGVNRYWLAIMTPSWHVSIGG
ncbi:hypothetical protein LRP88_11543 [Fusarium phalaenopsidis]